MRTWTLTVCGDCGWLRSGPGRFCTNCVSKAKVLIEVVPREELESELRAGGQRYIDAMTMRGMVEEALQLVTDAVGETDSLVLARIRREATALRMRMSQPAGGDSE